MYRVVVYEDDRQTVAGTIVFHDFEDAEHYAKLNQPCNIWSEQTGCMGFLIRSFGFEEEE